MRLWITAFAILFLATVASSPASAQTGIGILDVWLKARESPDAPNDQKVTLYTKSKALVIGIDGYDGRSWPQLSNGIRDAEEVAKALVAQGFEVTLKKDLKSGELDSTLRDFFIFDGSDPNARLLLWFAGHGNTIDGEAYLVPADAPSPKSDAEFRSKAISLRRFGEYMREARARHVLAIFDSCFSGGVFNVARSLPSPAITLATTQPVRQFISSGEAEQQVSDDGVFRKLFLDVLAGKEPNADANHDGYVTGTELGLFLHQKMTNLTNNRQTPRYGKLNVLGYDRGDFVFQVGKPESPAKSESAASQGPLPVVIDQKAEQRRDYEFAAQIGTKEAWDSFLKAYTTGIYADLARAQRAKLIAEQAKAEEAAARIEAALRAKAAEQARAAEQAAQAKSAAEAKAAEIARAQAEEQAKAAAEAARLKAADAARAATEQTARAKVAEESKAAHEPVDSKLAALTASDQPPKTADTSPVEIARHLQIELRRVGCLTSNTDGDWNANARKALELVNTPAALNLDTKLASIQALDAVRLKGSRICPLACEHGYHADGERCVETICKAGLAIGDDGTCERLKERPARASHPPQKPAATSDNAPAPKGSAPGQVACDAGGCRQLPSGCKPSQTVSFINRGTISCQ
jgi:hypothetical protein